MCGRQWLSMIQINTDSLDVEQLLNLLQYFQRQLICKSTHHIRHGLKDAYYCSVSRFITTIYAWP